MSEAHRLYQASMTRWIAAMRAATVQEPAQRRRARDQLPDGSVHPDGSAGGGYAQVLLLNWGVTRLLAAQPDPKRAAWLLAVGILVGTLGSFSASD